MALGPKLTCSVIDTNSVTVRLTGNKNVLVRHFSSVKATMSAVAQDAGAAINNDMYIIRHGTETEYGTTHYCDEVLSNEFTFSAEDSNGNIAVQTMTPTMIEYIKLTCNLGSGRPNAAGEMDVFCSGDYFNGSFGAYSNGLTVYLRYRESGGVWGSDIAMTITKSGNRYTATKKLTGLDYEKYYDFKVIASDSLMDATAGASRVRSLPIFHWGENDVVFEVPVTFNAGTTGGDSTDGGSSGVGSNEIEGDLHLIGKNGGGNYGSTLYFGDVGYCYISEYSDDNMTIKGANSIDLVTPKLKHNGEFGTLSDYGTWTPDFDIYNVSYTEQDGWYTKAGNVVTVGFRIKATVGSSYTGNSIIITGLPFVPAVAGSGGGMCSGAYMTSTMNFQCFVAETDGTITIRSQSCNVSAGQNLTTSASGARYPSSGTLALSGTITYVTN